MSITKNPVFISFCNDYDLEELRLNIFRLSFAASSSESLDEVEREEANLFLCDLKDFLETIMDNLELESEVTL